MKFYKLIGTAVLPFISLMGCAEEGSATGASVKAELTANAEQESSLSTELKGKGEILSIKKEPAGTIKASYFFSEPPTKEDLANKILEMMEEVEISDEFIQKISGRLIKNRSLRKDNFSLPLTDMDGTVYQFDFLSDAENSFFVINYSSK
ncbi:hypothetical protein [Microbulbifer mangrovi]|uniref:hypothetical protein n=1 Tax=Microbulbifer mangrovi TaxID=927787 RepID=UPI000990923A|nr:hypothetical protein [Microbulbifer mangrovi]